MSNQAPVSGWAAHRCGCGLGPPRILPTATRSRATSRAGAGSWVAYVRWPTCAKGPRQASKRHHGGPERAAARSRSPDALRLGTYPVPPPPQPMPLQEPGTAPTPSPAPARLSAGLAQHLTGCAQGAMRAAAQWQAARSFLHGPGLRAALARLEGDRSATIARRTRFRRYKRDVGRTGGITRRDSSHPRAQGPGPPPQRCVPGRPSRSRSPAGRAPQACAAPNPGRGTG